MSDGGEHSETESYLQKGIIEMNEGIIEMNDMVFGNTGKEPLEPDYVVTDDVMLDDVESADSYGAVDQSSGPSDPEPGEGGDPASDGEGGKARAWVRPLAIAVGAVLVLAAAGGGYAYAAWNVGKGVDAAASYASSEDTVLSAALKDAKELLESIGEGQVADSTTLDALSEAVKTAEGERGVDVTAPNRLLVWALLDAQDAYDTDAEHAAEARKALDRAVEAVESSVDEQTVNQAKATLQGKVDTAGQLLTDSDGQVQDDATRETLRQAIDQANALLGDDSASVDDLDQVGKAIDDATTGVNDSMKAKQDADAQAAAEAAAAAAAAQAAQQAQQSYTPSYSGGYSNSSGGYTGGGYTPSYSGGGSSSPSGGSSASGSGNSGNLDWLNHINDGGSACVDGYCPIG